MKYFDFAATTPLDPVVLEAMMPYLTDTFGNAGSLHRFGHEASQALMKSREQVASFLGATIHEVYFTAGATEANNIVIQGLMRPGDHLITTKIEHPCVLKSAQFLKDRGLDVTFLPVSADGVVSFDDVRAAIRPNTRLISVMMVNNEIGTIQPIQEISALIKEFNADNPPEQRIYFHTDAVQAIPYMKLSVDELGVDALSFSAHKIYGPKGVGALYIRRKTPVYPLMMGGGQESGVRPGTENIPGIVGLATAVTRLEQKYEQLPNLQKQRDRIISALQQWRPDMVIHGSVEKRIPTNLNVSFPQLEAEQLLYQLDAAGIAVSSVSACSSQALEPSHVIQAIGGTNEQARGTIRISLGYTTTPEDVNALLAAFESILT